jgi:hypothetical protein
VKPTASEDLRSPRFFRKNWKQIADPIVVGQGSRGCFAFPTTAPSGIDFVHSESYSLSEYISPSEQCNDQLTVIAIVGSRDFQPISAVALFVMRLRGRVKIVSGRARGVDMTAVVAAKLVGFDWEEYPATWRDANGKLDLAAGYKRNRTIVLAAQWVIAFWDGSSRGTLHSIKLAKKYQRGVKTYTPDRLPARVTPRGYNVFIL